MDTARFDRIASTFAATRTRRGTLHLLGAMALAVGGLNLLGPDEGAAKRRKKKNKGKGKGKGKDRCFSAGAPCSSDAQCCTDTTKRICEVAGNAGNSDTTCCGGLGATCGGANEDGDALGPFCCADFACGSDTASPGTCLIVKKF